MRRGTCKTGRHSSSREPLTHHVLEGGHGHIRAHGEPDGNGVHLGILHAHAQPGGKSRATGPATATSQDALLFAHMSTHETPVLEETPLDSHVPPLPPL